MAIYVEREGIEGCINKINSAIETLQEAARTIDSTMGELPSFWQGQAYDKARSTYDEEYKKLLTKDVPEQVDNFKEFIKSCKDTIVDIDNQLSGK